MELMNTKQKNWAGLIGFALVAGAILYPFMSIGDNASPFDHFLKAGYGYENPDLDYGDYSKPVTLQALPFDGEVIEDGNGVDDVPTIGDVDPIVGGTPSDESTINSTIEVSDPIEVSEPIVIPITPQPPAQPPTQSVISDSFPNHLPQKYIGNGHQ